MATGDDEIGAPPLTRAECLDLVISAPYGRVVYTSEALPAVLPVPFGVDDEAVTFDVPAGTRLATSAAREEVLAFQVDSLDVATGSGWTIMIIGRARHADAGPDSSTSHSPWLGGGTGVRMRLSLDIVTGRRTARAPH